MHFHYRIHPWGERSITKRVADGDPAASRCPQVQRFIFQSVKTSPVNSRTGSETLPMDLVSKNSLDLHSDIMMKGGQLASWSPAQEPSVAPHVLGA